MSLKAKFWASRLEFELGGWVLSLEGWNLSFEARFWASRLDLRLEGVDGGGEGGEGGEGEGEGKISPMCESIGHRPFGAAAQKERRKEKEEERRESGRIRAYPVF